MNITYRQGVLIILLVGVCLLLCKREQRENDASTAKPSTTVTTDSATIDYENVYKKVSTAIDLLPSDNDTVGKKRIFHTAWDSVAGVFYCPGKSVLNPSLPEAARKEAAVRAATITAHRWAILFTRWRRNGFHDESTRLNGQVTYDAVMFEQFRLDTLHMLLQVPIGSVVVEPAISHR